MKKSDRDIVFKKFGGKCAYCGCELMKGWNVDHFEPIGRSTKRTYTGEVGKLGKKYVDEKIIKHPHRDVIENYMPSCGSCNRMKSDSTLDQFRSVIAQFVVSLNTYSTQYKFAKRYGLVKETDFEVKFYFETL